MGQLCGDDAEWILEKVNITTTCIYYLNKALVLSNSMQYIKPKLELYSELANQYSDIDAAKAIHFFRLEKELRDSIYSASQIAEIQNLTENEQERQKELIAKQIEEQEQRKRNIQYAGIAIATISFLVLFIFLSRSIIVNASIIQFIGVTALLIVFEFINLLLHPFLQNITHDSPLFMLLALVCIAAMLVPLHHALQKWITQKMVEKNKKIRLTAAKRTIQKLENENNANE